MSRIRITGGVWRSRLVQVANAPGLRPTPDRVRETLFNWLGQNLTGWRCLDLFAGSGILGFECASRGAAETVLVENNPQAFSRLSANAAAFGGERLRLVCADALEFAAREKGGFDLILLDPPYRQAMLGRVAPWLPRLGESALVYAEAEHPLDALGEWRTTKRGRAGQVFHHLLERQ